MSIRNLKRAKNSSRKKSPLDAKGCNNRGTLYDERGNWRVAAKWYERAIKLDPSLIDAIYNLGSMRHLLGESGTALELYERSLELAGDNLDAINNIASILYDQGRVDEALIYFRKAAKLAPGNDNLASTVISCLNYIPGVQRSEELQAAKDWWQTHGKPQFQRSIYPNSKEPERRLRVGYISPDLREHSVAYFIKPLLAHHNHTQVETFCYSHTNRPDNVTNEIRQLSNHWRDITTSNTSQAVRQIMADRIDILIDLAGHMLNHRLDVLSRSAAPIQLSWLGYPNTTGLPTMQYRLTDAIADPPGDSDPFYSEQLIYLPTFLCYSPPDLSIPTVQPPCLERGYITFGSFNNPAKMNPEVISAWAAIMQQTPHSRLILKGLLLRDKDTRKRYKALFAKYGIAEERLDLMAFQKSPTKHFTLYNDVDVCLDTFPYNGTTTTLEAMWMGVPVIVLNGDRHASRVGASILTHSGWHELIAPTKKAYIATASQLAASPARLQVLRKSMRPNLLKSPICQAGPFASQIETTFRQLWRHWCEK